MRSGGVRPIALLYRDPPSQTSRAQQRERRDQQNQALGDGRRGRRHGDRLRGGHRPAADANPSSGVNIRGKESFNTDVLMSTLCSDMSGADKSFVLSINTGELVDSAKAHGKAPYCHVAAGASRSVHSDLPYGEHWALVNGWEVVVGNCEFPHSYTWTWLGKERRPAGGAVSTPARTCGPSGSTRCSTSITTTGATGQPEVGTTVHSWRGRGYDRIWSFGHYVDTYADVVNPDGPPPSGSRRRARS
ncbi:hypothetical protein [Streptomyces guryensis]|uniref:Uncharacterized protein n=1 Tax=Streptomyces guryensis TaxID=2886947 RepID=A0A9Q3VVL2_9ACTN|nr:hypothetical protein [Streptomyces guryensis]MCD9878434.1 hypothetical protein [Streptomyces guryensis]